jgi:hypothetical protein
VREDACRAGKCKDGCRSTGSSSILVKLLGDSDGIQALWGQAHAGQTRLQKEDEAEAGSAHTGSYARCQNKHIESQALFKVELASCRQEMEEVRHAISQ